MARPTPLQRYRLFLIGYTRWFGATFAGMAIVITASDLPSLLRSGDPKQLALDVGGGTAFLLIGLALYRVGSAVQRRYRTHIEGQID